MVLSMKPDMFKKIHPDAFEILTNPGPAPDPAVIAAASTATTISDIYRAYALESAIYAEYVTAERISVKTALFKIIHPDAFEIPTNPGPAPDPAVTAAASTATKIADIYKAYALESAVCAEYVTAERISVKIALDSMSELYYKALKNAYTRYAGVTLRQLLDHLVNTYAAIDQFDLEKNQENMTARYVVTR